MRLRLRSSTGISTLNVNNDASLDDLQKEIQKSTNVEPSFQLIKFGFPPKNLDLSNSTVSLTSLGLKDGEQLVLEQVGRSKPETKPSEPGFKAPVATVSSDKEAIPVGEGFMVARIQADDNSCLFRSVAYVLERNSEAHSKLRQLVVKTIRENPHVYTEAILGQDPSSYCNWISKPNSWGGALELRIFADHYKTEICSIDVITGRVDRFGEEDHYPQRCLVMYSGIHYDALALALSESSPKDFDQTIFDVSEPNSEKIVEAGVQLALIWQKKRKFTDLANFTLKCDVCKKGLKGEKDAQQHANATGHARFSEY